jgi:virginiamycin B lyase
VGKELTRQVKDESAWAETVRRMEGYFAMLTPKEAKDLTQVLTKGFDGIPVATVQNHIYHPGLARATVKEWVVGDGMSFVLVELAGLWHRGWARLFHLPLPRG